MNLLPFHSLPIAVAEATETVRSLEFDLPTAPWQWLLAGAAIALVAVFVVALNLRDAASFSLLNFLDLWQCRSTPPTQNTLAGIFLDNRSRQ